MFLPGNTFTVQMSDIAGNFVNATNIGSGSGVTFTIPKNTPPGHGYKIRVVSTKPVMISLPETIGISKIPYPQITGANTVCEIDTIHLNPTDTITCSVIVKYRLVNSDTSFDVDVKDPMLLNASAADRRRYILTAMADNSCYAFDPSNITVYPKPVVTSATNN